MKTGSDIGPRGWPVAAAQVTLALDLNLDSTAYVHRASSCYSCHLNKNHLQSRISMNSISWNSSIVMNE